MRVESRSIVWGVVAAVAAAWSGGVGPWPVRAAEWGNSEFAASGSAPLIDDHFLDASASSPLPGFRAYDGAWRATAGVVYAEPAAGSKLIWDELVLTTGEAGCEVLFPDDRGGNAGLIVKVSKPGVGADAFNGYEVSLDPQGQRLRLGRHVQAFELIRDEPCVVPVNRWISLVVRMSETRLEILVDGRSVLEYEDTQQPLREGKVGFRPWMRSAQFRDLWVVAEGQRRSIPLVEPAPDAQQLCAGWIAVERGTAAGTVDHRPAAGGRCGEVPPADHLRGGPGRSRYPARGGGARLDTVRGRDLSRLRRSPVRSSPRTCISLWNRVPGRCWPRVGSCHRYRLAASGLYADLASRGEPTWRWS